MPGRPFFGISGNRFYGAMMGYPSIAAVAPSLNTPPDIAIHEALGIPTINGVARRRVSSGGVISNVVIGDRVTVETTIVTPYGADDIEPNAIAALGPNDLAIIVNAATAATQTSAAGIEEAQPLPEEDIGSLPDESGTPFDSGDTLNDNPLPPGDSTQTAVATEGDVTTPQYTIEELRAMAQFEGEEPDAVIVGGPFDEPLG